jgi:hypothetical protein
MPFTGKATFDAGADLPELAEDVADIVSIVAAFETPLLDHLGDPRRAASSTIHEWLEDSLLPNSSTINQTTFTPNATDATSLTVTHGSRFRIGDQIRAESGREVMLVTAISTNVLTVVRGYGGTTKQAMSNGLKINIIGNAALEGDDRPATRFTNRSRKRNYTQIFSAAVEVSGSMRAVRLHGIADEVDYQKQERIREILRDLEHSVIAGVAPASAQQGSSSVRRTMNGIIPSIVTNAFEPGVGGFPQGGGAATRLDDAMLNAALRRVWEESGARPDTIVVSGTQKRRINEFMSAGRRFESQDTDFRNMVNVFESDFGVCRVILSRWVPTDSCLVLDSSRIAVLPLAGRSLQFKTLASGGDSEVGMVVGEYTLEFKNESAHGMIRGLEI